MCTKITMSTENSRVKAFFASIQVHFSDVWLESCITWCKTETLPPNYTLKDLQSKVYEQWLLLDLRDTQVPVLPPNLSTRQHFTFDGNFCLQMMQIVDISKPKLWQLQKIRNSNALTRGTQQDSEVVGIGKRLLQMTLTDGVQQVEAMEYKVVPCLNLNLAPGTKIRILGPVVVRRGRLMLEPLNVKILGGEVEELQVLNATENVLARWLKLPENPNPGAIEEKLFVVEKEEENEGFVSKPQPSPKPITELSEEEELLMAQEFDTAMGSPRTSSTPDLFEEPDFDNFDGAFTSTQAHQRQPIKLNRTGDSLDDGNDDLFNDIDIEGHLDEADWLQRTVPKPDVVTIASLMERKNSVTKGVFKIRAKFKSVEEKLTISEGEYKLVIKVEDHSGELIAQVHNRVVGDFAECSSDAIINLRNSVLGKNGAAIEKMMQAITKVKDKLLQLDNVLVIQLERDQVPVINEVLQ